MESNLIFSACTQWLEAATFTNGSEIVISFAGTKDIYDIGDNAANADLIAGLGSAQFA